MIFKQITLINPNHRLTADPTTKMILPPLGLAYLAAALEKKGLGVAILDANAQDLTPAQTARKALAQKPTLIGLSAVTNTIKEAWRIARLIKKKKDIPIVLGGVHPTILPKNLSKKTLLTWSSGARQKSVWLNSPPESQKPKSLVFLLKKVKKSSTILRPL